jgi:hypothetical protein
MTSSIFSIAGAVALVFLSEDMPGEYVQCRIRELCVVSVNSRLRVHGVINLNRDEKKEDSRTSVGGTEPNKRAVMKACGS